MTKEEFFKVQNGIGEGRRGACQRGSAEGIVDHGPMPKCGTAPILLDPPLDPPLSQREREIVCLVAQGFKNKEIAEKMFISEQTVKRYREQIYEKLAAAIRFSNGR